MRFRSRIDIWYIVLMTVMSIFGLWLTAESLLRHDAVRFGAALPILLLDLLLIVPLAFGTWYEFEAEHLHIHAWGITDTRLHYGLVTALRPAHSFRLAPALSAERVDIEFFNNGERLHLQVSPRERERFLALLETRTGRKMQDK